MELFNNVYFIHLKIYPYRHTRVFITQIASYDPSLISTFYVLHTFNWCSTYALNKDWI